MRDTDLGLALQYDDGVQTSVAINSKGRTVQVHKAQLYDKVWYHTGTTKGMDVAWSSSHQYDDGVAPSVALNDHGLVVEVHKAQTWDKLWYHVGMLNGEKIDFGSSHDYDSGVKPSVALDNAGWCVEVHESEGNSGLWYHVGILDKGSKSISWGDSHQYDSGVQPSIALTNDGFVVEVHKSEGAGTLWRRVGQVDVASKTVNWSGSRQYDSGQAPAVAVAADGSMAIQTHQSEGATTLWFSTSLAVDRMRWMENLYGTLQNKQLRQVTLPGSHDSGAYDMGTDRAPCHDAPDWLPGVVVRPFSTAHTLSMAGQLENGCRYFDLRPYRKDGTFYTYHDVLGAKVEDMLNDVAGFCKATSRELVILQISHFCQFDDKQHADLVGLIGKTVGSYLYKGSGNLESTTIGQFVGQGSRVVIWYNNDYILQHPADGFRRNLACTIRIRTRMILRRWRRISWRR
ncbi:MAG: hypothetical protein K0R39_1137 [Symbiobacteriaceae bacterium]|jgi:hypothetical protein|nr:hypothetical protein [Symbiobacteriaceae bacterium]